MFFRRFSKLPEHNITQNCRVLNANLFVNLYHELCDVIEIVNSTFTFQLIFVFFYFFILNLLTVFTHIWMFTHYVKYIYGLLSTDGVILLLNYILKSVMIHSSSSTTREAEETAVIVSRIINSGGCNKVQQTTFKKFLSQNQYRNLKLRTALFTINWKLLLTVRTDIFMFLFYHSTFILQIISTSVTYLVITCQFDPPTKGNLNPDNSTSVT